MVQLFGQPFLIALLATSCNVQVAEATPSRVRMLRVAALEEAQEFEGLEVGAINELERVLKRRIFYEVGPSLDRTLTEMAVQQAQTLDRVLTKTSEQDLDRKLAVEEMPEAHHNQDFGRERKETVAQDLDRMLTGADSQDFDPLLSKTLTQVRDRVLESTRMEQAQKKNRSLEKTGAQALERKLMSTGVEEFLDPDRVLTKTATSPFQYVD